MHCWGFDLRLQRRLTWELVFRPILSFWYSGRNDFSSLEKYLREGSQELKMKAAADVHMQSLGNSKPDGQAWIITKSLNRGGLVGLSRHLAVVLPGG